MLEIIDNRTIIVPAGIRYISQWSDYSLELDLFQTPHILDKKIPGCGFTEYCLTNQMNLILCSPRRILLSNKEQQHSDEVLYFKNELDSDPGIDKDISKDTKKAAKSDSDKKSDKKDKTPIDRVAILKGLEDDLCKYVLRCQGLNIPCKILVTYDSFRIVKETLIRLGVMSQFYTVIDEFQSIFVDSKFKSSTEIEFVSQLQDLNKVCYVSATPMIEDYLKRLDEFKDIPYYELDWASADRLRVIRPDIQPRVTKSITSEAKEIIKEYKEGRSEVFEYRDEFGILQNIQSKEAVFYVNSVANIISIINNANLLPDEVNILCADTYENRKKIKSRLGAKYTIGSVPLRHEQHKMFTICTRTVYLGADFYSTNAKTYIFSDANIDSLCVDITLDLPQILGRQRLECNPWKNRATLFYKTLVKDKELSREKFNEVLGLKEKKTNNLLGIYYEDVSNSDRRKDLAENYKKVAEVDNYKNDYVAVNTRGSGVAFPVFNKLVRIAEERAFEIQQTDYKDRFAVFSSLKREDLIVDETNNITLFLKAFDEFPDFSTKMRALCECPVTEDERLFILEQVPMTFKNFYINLGPERCKAQGYNITRMKNEIESSKINYNLDNIVKEKITTTFLIGGSYSKADIKMILSEIYNEIGYKKTPKASDLEEYFELSDAKITNKETGKRDHGFKILGIK